MATLLPEGKQSFNTSAGIPLVGGKLYTYDAGTSTPRQTFQDAAGATPNTNPVILDARGEATVFWSGSYKVVLKDANDATIWTVDNVRAVDLLDFTGTESASQGAGMVGFLYSLAYGAGTIGKWLKDLALSTGAKVIGWAHPSAGAVLTTQDEVNARTLSVFDFMTDAQRSDARAMTFTLDMTNAVNTALSVANTLASYSAPYGYGTMKFGGVYVDITGAGLLCSSGSINSYEQTGLVGKGIIRSTYNGNVVQVQNTTSYDVFGVLFRDITIHGDATKANQNGLALLRVSDGLVQNVHVYGCGADGFLLRQCGTTRLDNCKAQYNVVVGWHVMDGINSWSDSTPTNYPSNGNIAINCHFGWNGGPGLRFSGTGTAASSMVNGCRMIGGVLQYNYHGSAPGVGANAEDFSTGYFGNILEDVWFESTAVKYHVLKTASDVGAVLKLINCKHTANGATGWPERFVNVTVGTVSAEGCQGTQHSYRSVGGSVAPYRLTKASAIINLRDPSGSTLTANGPWVEDETNATTGLFNNMRTQVFNVVHGYAGARIDAAGATNEVTRSGDASPFFQAYGDRSIRLGRGTAAPDCGLESKAANVFGPMAGDSFMVGGIAGETLAFNAGAGTGAVDVTLSGNAPTGATSGGPLGWLRINVAGADRFVPYW